MCVRQLMTINAWTGGVFVCLPSRRGAGSQFLSRSIYLKVMFLIPQTCILVRFMNTEQFEVKPKGCEIKKKKREREREQAQNEEHRKRE